MLSSVPEGVQNAARMLDPLAKQDAELDSDILHQIDTLLDGPRRIVFNLEERISGPAVDAVLGALTSTLAVNDDEKRKRVADEVVTATNKAFDGHARQTWTLAMDVLTAIAEVAGHHAVAEAMTFVDHSAEPTLGRLDAERRAEEKRRGQTGA